MSALLSGRALQPWPVNVSANSESASGEDAGGIERDGGLACTPVHQQRAHLSTGRTQQHPKYHPGVGGGVNLIRHLGTTRSYDWDACWTGVQCYNFTGHEKDGTSTQRIMFLRVMFLNAGAHHCWPAAPQRHQRSTGKDCGIECVIKLLDRKDVSPCTAAASRHGA